MRSRFLTEKEADDYKIFLEDYHPSARIVYDFTRSNFGTIDGPTGVGKDTLRDELIKSFPNIYQKVVSTTSRPMRDGEQEGVQYHFRNLEFVDQALDEKRLLQAEVIYNQQISGLDFADIDSLGQDYFGVAILYPQAVKRLRKLNPDMKNVFLVPPSYQELVRRIKTSRDMKQDEVNRRLKTLKTELESALKDDNYYLVVNDDLKRCLDLVHLFFSENKIAEEEVSKSKICAQNMLNELSIMPGSKRVG